MDLKEIRALLRARVEGARSLKAAAIDLGIDADYLSSIIAGHHVPGPKVLKKIGVRKVISYERIEGEP